MPPKKKAKAAKAKRTAPAAPPPSSPDNPEHIPPAPRAKSGPKPKLAHVDIEQVERLAGVGIPEKDIAFVLGVSHDTLIREKEKNIEFANAIKRGKINGHISATTSLFLLVNKGNLGAICFYLCNRHPDLWQSINKVEVKHGGGIDLNQQNLLGRRIAANPVAAEAAARLLQSISYDKGTPAAEAAAAPAPEPHADTTEGH